MSILSLESVDKTFYLNGDGAYYRALSDISLEVNAGTITVIAGPSGSGKTTLLSIIGLMSRPTAGRVRVLGKETTLMSERFRTLFRRDNIGVMFQEFNLIPDLTALENMNVVQYPMGKPYSHINKRSRELLGRFKILDRAGSLTATMSGGEKQRLALARALIADPELLLIDEPTAHLDSKLSEEVVAIFRELKEREKRTLLICSHDPLITQSDLADRLLYIRDGRLSDG
jgi:putative ABC transport system ATP-binding protein